MSVIILTTVEALPDKNDQYWIFLIQHYRCSFSLISPSCEQILYVWWTIYLAPFTLLLREVQISAQRHRCSKAPSNSVAQPHFAVCTEPAVHVTLELASSTVFQSLRNRTRWKHISTYSKFLLRESSIYSILRGEKKCGCLLSSNKFFLFHNWYCECLVWQRE